MLHWNVRKQNRGFTLIEILTTAIIVGVVAAIAAPNFIGMYNRYQVEEGMRQIEGAIKEAQKQAIRNGKTCKISFTQTTVGGETRGFITTDADAANNGCLLNNRTMNSGVTVEGKAKGSSTSTDITTTPIPITFSNKGNIAENIPEGTISEGTFIISHNGTTTQKCVQIEGLLGNIISGNYDGTNCNSD